MRIIEVTWRHRNDFHYIAQCEHCDAKHRRGDGYADNFYCARVVPSWHCPTCGLNSRGEAEPKEDAAE